MRRGPAMPSARSRPDRTWGNSELIAPITDTTSPETSAGTNWPAPLYGTCVSFVPVMDWSISIARWCGAPLPAEA